MSTRAMANMPRPMKGTIAGALALASLAGCSQAPDYHPPVITDTPTAFREAGPWVPAAPDVPGGATEWWLGFGDPLLDQLESRIALNNPTLAAALARHDQAAAYVREARSALFPSIGTAANLTADRQSDTSPLRGSNQPDLY